MTDGPVRRVWVRRPEASPTQIRIREGDCVDDLREAVLRKYANSLGRQFDAPDIALYIILPTRQRQLGPSEDACSVLDSCFPDGQADHQALIVEVPGQQFEHHRTSSRAHGTPGVSPLERSYSIHSIRSSPGHGRLDAPRRVSGQLPTPPVEAYRPAKPSTPRQRALQRTDEATEQLDASRRSIARVEPSDDPSPRTYTPLDSAVPAINVLLVEDNIISLRVLEKHMKRIGVRYQTAVNGEIAVQKWTAGHFHLILMDIQMDVMDGIQATGEIRRLERANGVGILPTPPAIDAVSGAASGRVLDPSRSPVIIVALTASSLESDRRAALTAGCNDFITKPVNPSWLEKKIKEWGCMQALIDYDGWRTWKSGAVESKKAE